MDKNDLLPIGELARRTGLAVSAIRFYEEKGLIRSIGRTAQQRDTLYRPVPEERRAASFTAAELTPVILTPPRKRVAAA